MAKGNGELPDGGDDGKTELIIKAESGQVIMRFREPRLWISFDPSNAAVTAKHNLDCPVEGGARVEIKVPKRQVSDAKRKALIARAMHIARGMQDKGRKPEVIAQHVVDSILAGID